MFIVEAVVAYGLVDLGWCAAGIIQPGSLILFSSNQSVIQWLPVQGIPDPRRGLRSGVAAPPHSPLFQLLNAVSRVGSCIAGLDGRRAREPDAA